MTISDKETTKKAASSLKGWLVAICVQKNHNCIKVMLHDASSRDGGRSEIVASYRKIMYHISNIVNNLANHLSAYSTIV